ncbi:cupin domain-containing protein [Amycolatopsis nigrescens]|uniref:cupin domain-containing protein n=1 Tax=Amycolatopsis nigrescens TaxID=381445 RepID=UPI0003636434|nr:cupin domain-containing protein [Amycolatopsis nigrescens]
MDSDVSAQPVPYVLPAGAGTPGAAPEGSQMLLKATAAQTGGMFGMVEGVDRPGFATILHRHDAAEAWYILDGDYDYYVDGQWLSAGVGAFVFVPGGLPHGLRAGGAGGRKLTLIMPGGMEGFFQDVHTKLERGELSQEALGELGRQYHIAALGPLPETPVSSG